MTMGVSLVWLRAREKRNFQLSNENWDVPIDMGESVSRGREGRKEGRCKIESSSPFSKHTRQMLIK